MAERTGFSRPEPVVRRDVPLGVEEVEVAAWAAYEALRDVARAIPVVAIPAVIEYVEGWGVTNCGAHEYAAKDLVLYALHHAAKDFPHA